MNLEVKHMLGYNLVTNGERVQLNVQTDFWNILSISIKAQNL